MKRRHRARVVKGSASRSEGRSVPRSRAGNMPSVLEEQRRGICVSSRTREGKSGDYLGPRVPVVATSCRACVI